MGKCGEGSERHNGVLGSSMRHFSLLVVLVFCSIMLGRVIPEFYSPVAVEL